MEEIFGDVGEDGVVHLSQSPRQRRQITLIDTGLGNGPNGGDRGVVSGQRQPLHLVGGAEKREAILADEADEAGERVGENRQRLRLSFLMVQKLDVNTFFIRASKF